MPAIGFTEIDMKRRGRRGAEDAKFVKGFSLRPLRLCVLCVNPFLLKSTHREHGPLYGRKRRTACCR